MGCTGGETMEQAILKKETTEIRIRSQYRKWSSLHVRWKMGEESPYCSCSCYHNDPAMLITGWARLNSRAWWPDGSASWMQIVNLIISKSSKDWSNRHLHELKNHQQDTMVKSWCPSASMSSIDQISWHWLRHGHTNRTMSASQVRAMKRGMNPALCESGCAQKQMR